MLYIKCKPVRDYLLNKVLIICFYKEVAVCACHCIKYARIRVFSVYVFSVFPFRDRIVDSILKQENTSLRKSVFWYILGSVCKKNSP